MRDCFGLAVQSALNINCPPELAKSLQTGGKLVEVPRDTETEKAENNLGKHKEDDKAESS